MVAVLPILVVAYLCQMSLGHTVRAGSGGSTRGTAVETQRESRWPAPASGIRR